MNEVWDEMLEILAKIRYSNSDDDIITGISDDARDAFLRLGVVLCLQSEITEEEVIGFVKSVYEDEEPIRSPNGVS